ncbi:MAG: hypothetical protein GPJ54_07050, partial [Candidatus Heimdallarchaeota archaeon]|nr:hypothetical protein [Candidatus Heimdallarchaeota archaeon]
MMRILYATLDKNPSFNSAPASIFGKAASFLIYDTHSNDYFILDDIFVDEDCSLHRDLKTMGVDNIVSSRICKPCHGNFIKAG